MYIRRFILLPRVHKIVCKDLDKAIDKYISIHYHQIQLLSENLKLHERLMKLMNICIENLIFFGKKYVIINY